MYLDRQLGEGIACMGKLPPRKKKEERRKYGESTERDREIERERERESMSINCLYMGH